MYYSEVKSLHRGEVYYIRFDDNIGHEMAMGRPGVIVSSELGLSANKSTVMVVYCTTNVERTGSHFVKLTTTNRICMAKCNEIYTVDRRRVGDYMCKLNDYEMKQIDNNILFCLGYDMVDNEEENESDVDENNEYEALKMEADMYKKLYEKALGQLVDLRFKTTVTAALSDVKKVEEKPKLPTKNDGQRINVNTSSAKEIAEFTGMGIQTAEQIVRYRNKNGAYEYIENLLKVPRFGNGCMAAFGNMLEV